MNGPEFNSLIAWRAASMPGSATVEQVVEALSVEGLPYDQIPEERFKYVTAFRHLSQKARRRVVECGLRAYWEAQAWARVISTLNTHEEAHAEADNDRGRIKAAVYREAISRIYLGGAVPKVAL